MKQLPKVLESKAKIRFQDCDPFNHLNNGSYIDYFMNHREDVLIKYYDVDIYKMARQQGKSWVVSSNQIAYLKPANLMETVTIQSQLIHFNKSDLMVEMRMYNEGKQYLKAVIWCSFVHFNLLNQKRETHTDNFMSLFNTINAPVEGKTFEERLHKLKRNPVKTPK